MPRKDDTFTIHREELYKKVWETPMRKLALEYGLSDVGLKNICKKLKVPTPPRGYWVRLNHGYKTPRTPPVKLEPNESTTYTLSECAGLSQRRGTGTAINKYSDEASALMTRLQQKMPIRIHRVLTEPHGSVSKTQKGFEKATPSTSTGLLHPKGSNCLDIAVAPGNTERVLLVADALVKFMEPNGMAIMTEKPGEVRNTYLDLFGEKIKFIIKESTNRYEVPPPKNSSWQSKSFRYEPNGKLQLSINGSGGNLRRTWAEGSAHKLEGIINGFVLGLVKVADYERCQRIEREERNRRWEEERRRIQQIQEAIGLEQQRQNTLEELTKLWVHSEQVRQFIAAVETKAAHMKLSGADRRKFELWKIWANAHADRLDPLSKGLPHALKIVEKPKLRQFYGL